MADLLIRGASLPKSEDENIIIYPDGTVVRFDFARRRSIKEANAVEIPDHGRLIDADELRANHGLGEICENCPVDKRYCQYEMIYTKMEVCGWIDDADTIIPASKEGGE